MGIVQLGSKAIGSTVKVKINNTDQNFLVVQHGRPDQSYDASFDGGTVLAANYNLTVQLQWQSSESDPPANYSDSNLHSYLQNTYYNLIDPVIRNLIKSVIIKSGYVTKTTGVFGVQPLNTKVFLLSSKEAGLTDTVLYTNVYSGTNPMISGVFHYVTFPDNDGVQFQYFTTNDRMPTGFSRTPIMAHTGPRPGVAEYIRFYAAAKVAGSWYTPVNGLGYFRPVFVLPQNLLVDDNGNIFQNTPPTVPPTITIPSTIYGGTTITISWGTSTDAEGNLSGYILQRSTDGGSNWTQIFQGPQTSTTDNIAFGTPSIMYRVLAFDSEGLQSGWRNSSQVTVINNRPPATPGTIQVPLNVIGGGFIVITWGASTDPDNNLVGYRLERSVNGGGFGQIYEGPNLNFTDSITMGLQTVQYRVKAFDAYNFESDFSTSPLRTIDNNRPPAITSATTGDMGTINADFSWAYIVNDDDGDTVTVTERVNNVEKRSFTATLGQANTFDVSGVFFMALLNGLNTMQVVATDNRGKSATHTVTFTKAVHSLSIQLKNPILNMIRGTQFLRAEPISRLVMNIVRSIPPDAAFHVLATNNANDPSPVWEDITQNILHGYNYVFDNTTVVNGNAFSFKITASRGPGNTGGFVSTIGGAFD